MPNDTALNLEALRDLIGISRALWVAFGTMGPEYKTHRDRVAAAGAKLTRALEKAGKGAPGTWNHNTAAVMATEATEELCALIDKYFPAAAVVRAAGDRITKR